MRNLMLGFLLSVAATVVSAQFATPPTPAGKPADASNATNAKDYRRDGARHLYAQYAALVYKGKLPPMLYGVAITETEIDEAGNVVNVTMVRPPAAPEVGPWVMGMIHKSGKFPPPARMGRVKYLDIWLVHKSGKFQLDTLTEGQQ